MFGQRSSGRACQLAFGDLAGPQLSLPARVRKLYRREKSMSRLAVPLKRRRTQKSRTSGLAVLVRRQAQLLFHLQSWAKLSAESTWLGSVGRVGQTKLLREG